MPNYSHRMVGSSTVDAMAVFRVSDVPLLPGRYKVVAHLPATRLACGHITPGVIIPITAHWSLLADPTVVSYLWEGHHVFLSDYYVRPILLCSGETRILIGFHAADGELYFGWVTYDPVTFVLDEAMEHSQSPSFPPPPPPPLYSPPGSHSDSHGSQTDWPGSQPDPSGSQSDPPCA